jgi:hypothetical protein
MKLCNASWHIDCYKKADTLCNYVKTPKSQQNYKKAARHLCKEEMKAITMSQKQNPT